MTSLRPDASNATRSRSFSLREAARFPSASGLFLAAERPADVFGRYDFHEADALLFRSASNTITLSRLDMPLVFKIHHDHRLDVWMIIKDRSNWHIVPALFLPSTVDKGFPIYLNRRENHWYRSRREQSKNAIFGSPFIKTKHARLPIVSCKCRNINSRSGTWPILWQITFQDCSKRISITQTIRPKTRYRFSVCI